MVSHEMPFSVNVVHQDGSLLLALAGELDIAARPVLTQAVGPLITPQLRAVTLDLAALEFVDVVGLRALLDVKGMAAGAQAEFRLRVPTDRTCTIIRLVGFAELEAVIEANPSPAER